MAIIDSKANKKLTKKKALFSYKILSFKWMTQESNNDIGKLTCKTVISVLE